MINLSEEDKEFLFENLDNGESLIKTDDVNDILDALNTVINRKGFKDYYYNDFGEKAQKIYDRIYNNN